MSWRHVFDCDKFTTHSHGGHDLDSAAARVANAGYRFMLYNGIVYFVCPRAYGETVVEDTGLKGEDLR